VRQARTSISSPAHSDCLPLKDRTFPTKLVHLGSLVSAPPRISLITLITKPWHHDAAVHFTAHREASVRFVLCLGDGRSRLDGKVSCLPSIHLLPRRASFVNCRHTFIIAQAT